MHSQNGSGNIPLPVMVLSTRPKSREGKDALKGNYPSTLENVVSRLRELSMCAIYLDCRKAVDIALFNLPDKLI